jgi:hypothetical protein
MLFEEYAQLIPLRFCQYYYRWIANRTKAVSLITVCPIGSAILREAPPAIRSYR